MRLDQFLHIISHASLSFEDDAASLADLVHVIEFSSYLRILFPDSGHPGPDSDKAGKKKPEYLIVIIDHTSS